MDIMMDPAPLFPDMFHPTVHDRSRTLAHHAEHTTRTRHPPRYYLTDFSNAKRYKPEAERLAAPVMGLSDSLKSPEFKDFRDMDRTPPRDPFPTDVYYLGNMIRRQLMTVRSLGHPCLCVHILTETRRSIADYDS